jgi:hypothetical protein
MSYYRPMDPRYLMGFLSETERDKATLKQMAKALQKYHNAVAKAAVTLDSELNKIKTLKTNKKSK